MKLAVVAAVILWISAGLQLALAPRIGILGADPDFLLISLSVLCLFATRTGGAFLGFFAGILYGSPAGANLASYVISRTIVGFVDGWLADTTLEASIVFAAVNAFLVTIFCQLLMIFFAPPTGIASFLGATIASAMYNGVLAVPLYALLKRVLGPRGA